MQFLFRQEFFYERITVTASPAGWESIPITVTVLVVPGIKMFFCGEWS